MGKNWMGPSNHMSAHFLFNMFLTSDETCDYFCQFGYGVSKLFFLKVDFFMLIMNSIILSLGVFQSLKKITKCEKNI